MITPFYYSTTYVLDKSHFVETFDASVSVEHAKAIYLKAIIIGFLGAAILLFTPLSAYFAWFIVALGVLEALSIRFRKPWWLIRQMISKAANSELTLTINESSVSSKSFYVESKILWDDVTKIEQTAQGWLLYHASGKNYLSSRCLSPGANEFIGAKAVLKTK